MTLPTVLMLKSTILSDMSSWCSEDDDYKKCAFCPFVVETEWKNEIIFIEEVFPAKSRSD